MSERALLPCFVCGATLENVCPDAENQPYAGTTFWTPGHYGSTFFDAMDGNELALNVCDRCLQARRDRLAIYRETTNTYTPY